MQYQSASTELRSLPPRLSFWGLLSEGLVLAAIASLLTWLL